jgi:hypothetical protein
MEPKLTEAEVLYTDRQWHPATVSFDSIADRSSLVAWPG